MIDLKETLADYGVTKEQIIAKRPDLIKLFEGVDKFMQVYERNPTEKVELQLNSYVANTIDIIKKQLPDLFSADDEKPLSPEEVIESKFNSDKELMKKWIDSGDYGSIEDWFRDEKEESQIRMITYNNFSVFESALKSENELIISFIIDISKMTGVYPEMIVARNGEFLTRLVDLGNADFVSDAVDILKVDKTTAKSILTKSSAIQIAIEKGDKKIISLIEGLYEDVGVNKIVPKGEKVVEKLAEVKSIIDYIGTHDVSFDNYIVVKKEQYYPFKLIKSISDCVKDGDDKYQIIHLATDDSHFKDENSKVLFSDKKLTISQYPIADYEKWFSASKYQIISTLVNINNLSSVNDLITMLFIANTEDAKEYMLEMDNAIKRDLYLERLEGIIYFPESNKIGNAWIKYSQHSLENLRNNGFLDDEFCPTKSMYTALALHSFSFPVMTHPFERIDIKPEKQFTYDIFEGKFRLDKLFTDGEIMLMNYPIMDDGKIKSAMVDSVKSAVLNATGSETYAGYTKGFKKEEARIAGFIPFLYTIPTITDKGHVFHVRMLSYPDRRINWGVYEFRNASHSVFVNSLPISSAIVMNKESYKSFIYKGKISKQYLSNPSEGVIVEIDNRKTIVRALNWHSLLGLNFGKSYEDYYEKRIKKEHTSNISTKVSKDFLSLINSDFSIKADYNYPNINFKSEKDLVKVIEVVKPTPYVPKPKEKPAPIIKKIPVIKKIIKKVYKKDDRVYLTKEESRKELPKLLFGVFDKVSSLRGDERDLAIIPLVYDEVEAISPYNLVYLGFDIKQYAVTSMQIKITVGEEKYSLRMPSYLSGLYYITKS